MQVVKQKKRKIKLNHDIIRVDDAVKIIIPKTFIRCGYPMCKAETKKTIKNLYSEDINALA